VESSGDGDKKGTGDPPGENDPLLDLLKTFRASPHSLVREEMLAHIVQFEVEQLSRLVPGTISTSSNPRVSSGSARRDN
jgi:hypothetical protein